MYRDDMAMRGTALEMLRDDPVGRMQVVEEVLPGPGTGEVLLAVERFGLSSNNVSYAMLGDLLGHWRPFPTAGGWGRVPVWGVARVVAADPGVAREGARFAGYLPMATHVLMQAEPTAWGLRDTSPQREGMVPFYRELRAIDGDPVWREDAIDSEVAMMPVEPLAALLDEDLRRMAVGAVVISSASSRTAQGLGQLLRRRGVHVTGLTSTRGAAAVAGTGTFDTTVTYDRIATLDGARDVVYVDVAGDSRVTRDVHRQLGASLSRSIGVGGSHIVALEDPLRPDPLLTGPPVVRFSVGPRQIELIEEIGRGAVEDLRRRARRTLVAWSASRFSVRSVHGLDAAQEVWRQIAHGEQDPRSVVSVVP